MTSPGTVSSSSRGSLNVPGCKLECFFKDNHEGVQTASSFRLSRFEAPAVASGLDGIEKQTLQRSSTLFYNWTNPRNQRKVVNLVAQVAWKVLLKELFFHWAKRLQEAECTSMMLSHWAVPTKTQSSPESWEPGAPKTRQAILFEDSSTEPRILLKSHGAQVHVSGKESKTLLACWQHNHRRRLESLEVPNEVLYPDIQDPGIQTSASILKIALSQHSPHSWPH